MKSVAHITFLEIVFRLFLFSIDCVLFLLLSVGGDLLITIFQVTWQSYKDTLPESQELTGPNPPTSYLITDLHRLTMYTIFVYATNEKGRGVDSEEMNISTSAVGESLCHVS